MEGKGTEAGFHLTTNWYFKEVAGPHIWEPRLQELDFLFSDKKNSLEGCLEAWKMSLRWEQILMNKTFANGKHWLFHPMPVWEPTGTQAHRWV